MAGRRPMAVPRQHRRVWALGLLTLGGLAAFAAHFWLYPFLARHRPVPAEILVVEGWLQPPLLAQAMAWASSNGVKKIYTTGGPIEAGSRHAAWTNYAELAKSRLADMGFAETHALVAAPAPGVRYGRTRRSAQALKVVLGPNCGAFILATEGPHARHSWQSFQAEFGDGVSVGCLPLTPIDYDPAAWWRHPEGLHDVLGQAGSVLYDLLPGSGIVRADL